MACFVQNTPKKPFIHLFSSAFEGFNSLFKKQLINEQHKNTPKSLDFPSSLKISSQCFQQFKADPKADFFSYKIRLKSLKINRREINVL